MTQIVPLTSPEMLDTWLVRDLFVRAFPPGTLISGGFEENPDYFREMVADPNYVFLIGVEDTHLRGLAMLLIPEPGGYIPAQVVQFYNEGSAKLRGQMVDSIVEILRARGHIKLWAINQTDRPDSVWVRTFRRAGEGTRVGSVMEVRFKDGE